MILQSWHGSALFNSLVSLMAGATEATHFLNPRVKQMSFRLNETAVIAGLKTPQGWRLASDDEQRPAIERVIL